MGTFRAMDETWRFQAHKLIHRICKGIAQSMGAEIDVLVDVGYPVVNNDEKLYPIARKKAEEYVGRENVQETEVRMGSEDFGYYTQEIPGCFYRIGVMNESKGITSGVHTPTFNIDESAIEKGMGMMAWLGASIYDHRITCPNNLLCKKSNLEGKRHSNIIRKANRVKLKWFLPRKQKPKEIFHWLILPVLQSPARRLALNKEEVYKYTAKGNLVAVITNGTAVLGLGNIGPEASKP